MSKCVVETCTHQAWADRGAKFSSMGRCSRHDSEWWATEGEAHLTKVWAAQKAAKVAAREARRAARETRRARPPQEVQQDRVALAKDVGKVAAYGTGIAVWFIVAPIVVGLFVLLLLTLGVDPEPFVNDLD